MRTRIKTSLVILSKHFDHIVELISLEYDGPFQLLDLIERVLVHGLYIEELNILFPHLEKPLEVVIFSFDRLIIKFLDQGLFPFLVIYCHLLGLQDDHLKSKLIYKREPIQLKKTNA